MTEANEWIARQVLRLVGYYMVGEMDAEELSVRIDDILIAARVRAGRRGAGA
jgi:hypothetical protein